MRAYRWQRGDHTARCLAVVRHQDPPPAKGCACGFYARYTPPPRGASAATSDLVAGAVALWGRIELHAHGMRAEHARVVALALPYSLGVKRARTVAAAAALGIPAVPARRLVDAAVEHGAVIPRSMQPPDVMPNKRKAPGSRGRRSSTRLPTVSATTAAEPRTPFSRGSARGTGG